MSDFTTNLWQKKKGVKIGLCIEAKGFGARSWFGSPSFPFLGFGFTFGGFGCVPFPPNLVNEIKCPFFLPTTTPVWGPAPFYEKGGGVF